MNAAIQDAVFALIREERQCKPHQIALDKSLNFDLGMDGEDAVEFFQAFAKKFSVDMTELGEEWNLYFSPEGFDLFGALGGLLSLFTAPAHTANGKKLPMRISRVVEAAESRRWVKLPTTA
jgi:acyl carrier protein